MKKLFFCLKPLLARTNFSNAASIRIKGGIYDNASLLVYNGTKNQRNSFVGNLFFRHFCCVEWNSIRNRWEIGIRLGEDKKWIITHYSDENTFPNPPSLNNGIWKKSCNESEDLTLFDLR